MLVRADGKPIRTSIQPRATTSSAPTMITPKTTIASGVGTAPKADAVRMPAAEPAGDFQRGLVDFRRCSASRWPGPDW
ncbi:hypothetical protein [Actinoplanes sp. CA-252034]|uniref:hypothetical protein n=1 Tax=Actinoplanes sp. CA-252034 TaxID=3239906 RepID=UPI003D97F5BE